ncbi:MAG: hypothetical protein K2W92_02875 [Alphaproteobacteria bacterium]|nr:hypothetical protein [Alphaproteobacteria bacterium]
MNKKYYEVGFKVHGNGLIQLKAKSLVNAFYIAFALIFPEHKFEISLKNKKIKVIYSSEKEKHVRFEIDCTLDGINKCVQENLKFNQRFAYLVVSNWNEKLKLQKITKQSITEMFENDEVPF